jgi:DNA-binding response OmpR family regulator
VATAGGQRLALHRGPHILVAHDEPSMCAGLAGILRRAGFDVDTAIDFDGALAVLDKGEVVALVTSLGFPPEGCLALLDVCKAPPPAVVLNGRVEDTAMVTADPRVQSVLTRPYPLQALLDAVDEAAGRSETPNG